MTEERLYFFNQLPNLYRALKRTQRQKEIERLVESFLKHSFSADLSEKVKRFLELPSIGFIPADMNYFKIYSELIQLYVNGLFYSTVVLAGVLCERICYDILSNLKIKVKENELSEEQIACLYKINLFDIITLLREWELIREETRKEMIEINNKRNQYVHPSKEKTEAPKDSLEMIKRITKILANEFEIRPKLTGKVTPLP